MKLIPQSLAACLAASLLSAPVYSSAILAPDAVLEKAIACAKANAELSASFTLTFSQGGAASVSHRYDVHTDDWTFLTGDLATLNKRGRQAFENVSKEMGKIGGLVPRDLEDTVTQLTFVEETDDALVYSFIPGAAEGEDPMPDAMIEALETRFSLDRKTQCMSGLTMMSTHPFKPSLIVKMESFAFAYDFGTPSGSPIPLISGFRSAAKGSALLTSFDSKTTVTISDVEIGEAG